MGLFITLEIDQQKCLGLAKCGKCVTVCPVGIFGKNENRPQSIADNEDECTLCELCIESCKPDAISICKCYDPSTDESELKIED